MVCEDNRGRQWFLKNICVCCHVSDSCEQEEFEYMQYCIEIEKLRQSMRQTKAKEKLAELFEDVIQGDDVFPVSR